MIRTRQLPAPSHEPHHLPGALDPPSAQRTCASCVSHAPPPRCCFRFNWWCYHVGIVQKDHELPSFCLITFINLFWFMQCHVDAAKASRWLMINEVFKPRTSEHLPQICQQTFGEPSVMSNETVLVLRLEPSLSKKWDLHDLLWIIPIQTSFLMKTLCPMIFFHKESGPNKNFHPRPGCFNSQNHRVDSYPMYLYRFQGSNHSIALATFLLRPARGARGSAKGVPEANLHKDHMKPKWTHVSTIN